MYLLTKAIVNSVEVHQAHLSNAGNFILYDLETDKIIETNNLDWNIFGKVENTVYVVSYADYLVINSLEPLDCKSESYKVRDEIRWYVVEKVFGCSVGSRYKYLSNIAKYMRYDSSYYNIEDNILTLYCYSFNTVHRYTYRVKDKKIFIKGLLMG